MKISEICIKRPVLSIVVNLILILVGMVAFWRLPINEYPKFEKPTLSLETEFHGAGPEIIENTVTKVLEEELAKIEGLDFITSTSLRGKSNVYLHFNLDRSLDAAATDVLFKVARIRSLLPTDVRDPVMIKSDANASPVLYLALNSSSRTETDLADYARRYLENPLGNINGVSKVEILGGGILQPLNAPGAGEFCHQDARHFPPQFAGSDASAVLADIPQGNVRQRDAEDLAAHERGTGLRCGVADRQLLDDQPFAVVVAVAPRGLQVGGDVALECVEIGAGRSMLVDHLGTVDGDDAYDQDIARQRGDVNVDVDGVGPERVC